MKKETVEEYKDRVARAGGEATKKKYGREHYQKMYKARGKKDLPTDDLHTA